MKKLKIIGSLFAAALIIGGAYQLASAQIVTCPSGFECSWIDVLNVAEYGVPPSASPQNFWNDQATKEKLCQIKGYTDPTGNIQQNKWDKCNAEFYVVWNNSISNWRVYKCDHENYLSRIQCARPIPTNTVPGIRWADGIPTEASCNSFYTVKAEGWDLDGNLASVSVDKDGSAAAYSDGGDGKENTAQTSTYESSTRVAKFTAWATDTAGNKSDVITHEVKVTCAEPPVNNPPTGTFNPTCSTFSGTASDPNTPGQPVSVHFYADGTAPANFIGSALTDAGGNYSVPTPASVKTGTAKTVYAYAIDTTAEPNAEIGVMGLSCPKGSAPPTPPPVVVISADPTEVPAGGGTTKIMWTVSGGSVDACFASGDWSGNKSATGGEESIKVTKNSTFTLTCTGAGGPGTGTVNVNVGVAGPVAPPPASVTLTLSSNCVQPSHAVTMSSNAAGTVVSHIIEKDTNGDGVYGEVVNFGAGGGLKTHTTSFKDPGTVSLRSVVNGTSFSVQNLTVSSACGAPPPPPPPVFEPIVVSPITGPDCIAPGTTLKLRASATGDTIWYKRFQRDHKNPLKWYEMVTVKDCGPGPGTCEHEEYVGWWEKEDTWYFTFSAVGYTVDKLVKISNSCPVTPPPATPPIVPPSGGGGGASGGGGGGGGGGAIATFTLSAPDVKAKSLAGYSGLTEEIRVSVNPVSGFTAPIKITIDPSSLSGTEPEYSFGGGAFTKNPSALLSLDGGLYKYGGKTYLPIVVRFKGELSKGIHNLTIKGVGLPGGTGEGVSVTKTLKVDSRPAFPGYKEI